MSVYKNNFTITRLVKNAPKINGVFLAKIKSGILGRSYHLSLVFTSLAHSQKLNKIYRKKNKPANILSFSIKKNAGEIFLSPLSKNRVPELFIHGLCHLKGYRHGSKMESEEKKWHDVFQLE